MKLLFYRFHNLCEPDVLRAFEALGVAVIETEAIAETDLRGGVISKNVVTMLSEKLIASPVDAVFSINFFPSVSEVCNVFRIPYLSWIVTAPVMQLFTASVKNDCNRIFSFDFAIAEEVARLNPNHVWRLPMAAAVARSDKAIKECADIDRYKTDVSFIGSLYTEKNAFRDTTDLPEYVEGYLKGLLEAQLLASGADLIQDATPDNIIAEYKARHKNFFALPEGSFLTDRQTFAQLYCASELTVMDRTRTLRALSERFSVDLYTYAKPDDLPKVNFRGTAESTKEMPAILRASKINLNPTARGIRTGLALRLFDILAAGGFCMTNAQPELTEFFAPDETLVCYASTEELLEKTEYYLAHDKEREEIARAGQELVRARHTYEIRMEEMLRLAGLSA